MTRIRWWTVALAIGAALAVCACAGWTQATQDAPPTRPPHIRGGDLVIGEAPAVPSCAPTGGLNVSDSVGREMFEPLVREERGALDRMVFGEFSGHWAEKRSLVFVRGGHDKALHAQAAFDTDYGFFLGSVHGGTVHEHDDVLCFDLAVSRLDGSGQEERWRGRLELPR
jgi:hypothetical protein